MTRRFTRLELHKLVWSEPMTKLAKRFGVSDVALAKACRKADIPLPGLGYWAKLRHGKNPPRKPLKPTNDSGGEIVTLTPNQPGRKIPPQPLPDDVQARIARDREPSNRIRVAKTLSNPHPIVGAWLEEERQLRRDTLGFGDWPRDRRYSSPIEKRRLRILSTLFKQLEKRGFKIAVGRYLRELRIQYGSEEIEFNLEDRVRQRRVELTPEEKRDPYNLREQRTWKQVREPTGELVFRIKSWLEKGDRSEWRERPGEPLEDQLNDIICGFIVAAERLKTRRLRRDEEERRWRQAEEERWKQQQAREEEQNRLKRLIEKTHAWEQAARIRAYVDAVRDRARQGEFRIYEEKVETWAAWALGHADRLDPLVSGAYAENLSDSESSEL